MADSATTSLRLRKQSLGSNLNTWGDPYLNTDLDLIDAAIAGITTITFAGTSTSTATTLTSSNYSSDQARARVLVLNGTSSSNQTLTLPSVSIVYDVRNLAVWTGSAYFTVSGGSSVAAPTGYSKLICDGTVCTVAKYADYQGSALENLGAGTGTAFATPMYLVNTSTSNRSMGGFQINNLGTGSANADAVNVGQLNSSIASASIPGAAGTIKLNAADAAPDYASNKFAALGAIALNTFTSGTTAQLQIGAPSIAVASPVTLSTSTATTGALTVTVTAPIFVGATSTAAGTAGLVPAPSSGTATSFLSNFGTFASPQSFDPVLTQMFSGD